MADYSIEKNFLCLVGFSLLLNIAIFALIFFLPEEKPSLKQEPFMIDLQEMPEIQPPPRQDQTKRLSDQRHRVE